MFFDDEVQARASEVLAACRARGLKVATAESLTGGAIAAALTELAGASDVVERGFVVYSWEAKTQLLGVPWALLEAHGAVSEAVARAMALGALSAGHPRVQLTVAATGVAGPGPSEGKPAGTVHLACARGGSLETAHRALAYGASGRDAVRRAAVLDALGMLLACAEG
ncbi:MAG: CinA family protein [Deltaproteobacteria bacterium]|nr:CinA family protein [Deltaproteobacteria bacterium]